MQSSQTDRLLEALLYDPRFINGITRPGALDGLGIQNLTARLADLRSRGYHFKKTTHKWLTMEGPIKITTWELDPLMLPAWIFSDANPQ